MVDDKKWRVSCTYVKQWQFCPRDRKTMPDYMYCVTAWIAWLHAPSFRPVFRWSFGVVLWEIVTLGEFILRLSWVNNWKWNVTVIYHLLRIRAAVWAWFAWRIVSKEESPTKRKTTLVYSVKSWSKATDWKSLHTAPRKREFSHSIKILWEAALVHWKQPWQFTQGRGFRPSRCSHCTFDYKRVLQEGPTLSRS